MTPRERHTATLLPDGTVPIAGGSQLTRPAATLYRVAVGGNLRSGYGHDHGRGLAMSNPRFAQSDVLLDDGRALIAADRATYDARRSRARLLWLGRVHPAARRAERRAGAGSRELSMTKLTDSWVLAVGGIDSSGNRLASSELFDPGLSLDRFMTACR